MRILYYLTSFSVLIGAIAICLVFGNPYIELAAANPMAFKLILTCEMVIGMLTIHWIVKRFLLKKESSKGP